MDFAEHPRRFGETGTARHDRTMVLSAARRALQDADRGTSDHSDDVAILAEAVAERLGLDAGARGEVVAAAALHDIGKLEVPTEILTKPGALDEDEWRIVRQHTLCGERLLSGIGGLERVARYVRHSHERYDGGGYPDGLAGEQIPLASRIVFCADAYHAIRCDRPYRAGRPARSALAEVRSQSGRQFDPMVVDALVATTSDLRWQPEWLLRKRNQRLVALLLCLTIGGGAGGAWAFDAPVGRWISALSPVQPQRSHDAPRAQRAEAPSKRPPTRSSAPAAGPSRATTPARRTRRAKPAPGRRSSARAQRATAPAAPKPRAAVRRRAAPAPTRTVRRAQPTELQRFTAAVRLMQRMRSALAAAPDAKTRLREAMRFVKRLRKLQHRFAKPGKRLDRKRAAAFVVLLRRLRRDVSTHARSGPHRPEDRRSHGRVTRE